MRVSALLLFTVILVSVGVAQQAPAAKAAAQSKAVAAPTLPTDAPSKEQLIRLFDAMEMQKQLSGMLNAMSGSMEKMMPASMGDLSEKQKAGMAKLNMEMFNKVLTPEFVDSYIAAIIPVYQQHFTKNEIDDLISFYASPVGQKFLREQPSLTQESFTKVVPLMQKRVQDIMDEMNYEQRLKQVFADQEQEAPAAKR